MLKKIMLMFSIFAIVIGIVSFTSWGAEANNTEEHGIKGEYFDGMNPATGNKKMERIDPNVNFFWGEKSPNEKVSEDKFSVRWTGQIQPIYSDTYNFYITSDNGRRVWIDGKLIIDKWIDDWNVEYTGTAYLEAGKKYDIVVEYFEDIVGASVKLEWSSDKQKREVIPKSCLYPEISGLVAQPAITFDNNYINITCPIDGAAIYYTTDETNPKNSTKAYTGSISISTSDVKSGTIKAIALKDGKYSEINEKFVQVNPPKANIAQGSYYGPQKVTLSCSTNGATIYFTLNGSNPVVADNERYKNELTIDQTKTLKAIAVYKGVSSGIITYKYIIDALETPKSSLPSGTYMGRQSVVLSTTTSGAVIYYTQNGSNPTNYSTMYSGAIDISTTQVLKAVAYYNGAYSSVSTFNYTFSKVPAPTASIASGTFDSDGNTIQYVVLCCSQKNADIYYTLDGTEPTKYSMKYLAVPIEISDTATLKAVACYNEVFSEVSTYNYTIKKKSKFVDLDSYTWAKDQIESLALKNIIKGTSETLFSPAARIKRADFMCLLVRTLNLSASVGSNFSDVNPGDYFYNDIGILKSLGICSGVGNNKIRPNDLITRQDMMVLISRALQNINKLSLNGTAADIEKYSDSSEIAEYAQLDVASLIKEGIIQGSGNAINPKGTATRAETAVIMYRLLSR